VEDTGLAEVWTRKRPRIEQAGPGAVALAARLKASGMVVVQRPDGVRPLKSLVTEGAHLALGSGRGADPAAVLAWATSTEPASEALTMEEALTAFTRGAAYAEFSDHEKGHVTVGALADLAVLSLDPFSAPPGELAAMRSVLTIVGGRSVHDVP
jgi:predicted amidohydrolase YtcJ